MARRRYRRYRRKIGKWSPNIQSLYIEGTASPSTPEEYFFMNSFDLATNPKQQATLTSQTYTVKNIEVSGNIETISSSSNWNIEEVTYYIMYLPEGHPISSSLPYEHPEWILAYKYYGSAVISNSGSSSNIPPKVKTRLAHKLQTGDKIIFMFNAKNASNANIDVKFQGIVRWWTKAN